MFINLKCTKPARSTTDLSQAFCVAGFGTALLPAQEVEAHAPQSRPLRRPSAWFPNAVRGRVQAECPPHQNHDTAVRVENLGPQGVPFFVVSAHSARLLS